MNTELRELCQKLRAMTSEDAADWLLENYPSGTEGSGKAIRVLPHRSWKRPDQVRLARHYLQSIPFAGPSPYEAFASFMALPRFVSILREHTPETASDLNLLLYYLAPVLKAHAKNVHDERVVDDYLDELRQKQHTFRQDSVGGAEPVLWTNRYWSVTPWK